MNRNDDLDIIARQRLRSNVSMVSQELKSDKSREEQLSSEKRILLNRDLKNFKNGYETIIKFLNEDPKFFQNYELQEMNIALGLEDCIIDNSHLKILNDLEAFSKVISGTSTIQQLWNISSDVLVVYYVIGDSLFQEKKFLDAENVFTFLTQVNPYIYSFWICKGRSNESQEKWEDALISFQMAQSINPEHPLSHEGLIRVYENIGKTEELDNCINLVLKTPEIREKIMPENE